MGVSKRYILEEKKAQCNYQTSQELRMLSSVTLDCQVTKIVMNSGSQLSVSQMSQVSRIVFVIVPKKFQRSSKEVPKKFQRSSNEVPRKFQRSFKEVPKKFQRK